MARALFDPFQNTSRSDAVLVFSIDCPRHRCVDPNQTKTQLLLVCALKQVKRLDGLVRTLALYGVLERNAIDSPT